MANTKYELIQSEKITIGTQKLFRIRALKNIGTIVKKDELGGYISSEKNLATTGDCWVFDRAKVYGDSSISGDAQVRGWAQVYERAEVSGNSRVYHNAKVYGNSQIMDKAIIRDWAEVYGDSIIKDYATIQGKAKVDSGLYKGASSLGEAGSDSRSQVPATVSLKGKLSQGLKGVSKGDWNSRDYKEAKSDGE